MSIEKYMPFSKQGIIIHKVDKEIKVRRCAKKLCDHNKDNSCEASPFQLVDKNCFNKFTGGKAIKKEEPLDEVFK